MHGARGPNFNLPIHPGVEIPHVVASGGAPTPDQNVREGVGDLLVEGARGHAQIGPGGLAGVEAPDRGEAFGLRGGRGFIHICLVP